VYQAVSTPTNQPNQNRYLALAAAKTDDDADMDPIYVYDTNGNRISMIDPTGLTTYNYDVLNRLTSITNNQGLTTTFTYDALGRRTSMTHANGVQTTYSYDAASQLLSLVHQLGLNPPINSFTYTYDKVGNRKTKVDNNGTANYTYDTLNRLVQATNPIPTNPLETFNYDPVGNRTDSNQNGLSTFNQANQLLEDANFTYQYDNNGNLTQKTNKTTSAFTLYEYDAENKLIRVVREDGSIVNYKYDGLGRRIEKEVDSVVTQYIYDNEDILLELDGANDIAARYTHGFGFDEPLIVERSGQTFYYHADGLGSINELTNSTGIVSQSYTYSSFGRLESMQNPSFFQPFTFGGREFDPETALYYYRERFYDSSVGRFLQEDPVGFWGGDLNLYSYVSNNPINWLDPHGLSPAGWVIRLTTTGFKKISTLASSAAARARRQGKNVLAQSKQAAKAIEKGAFKEGEDVLRHKAHSLPGGSKGRPHFQTKGKRGHTFWSSLIGFLGTLLDPFDAISGELADDEDYLQPYFANSQNICRQIESEIACNAEIPGCSR